MEAVFLKLLHMSLSASWLILMVLILRPVLKKAPKWVFCLLWGMVALRLVCPVALESRLSLIPASDALALPVPSPGVRFWAAAVWLAGMAGLLLYGWGSALRLRHSVREAVRLEGNAYLCDWVKSPFILGVISPKIYLPSDLDSVQREYVLAHERAHLRRRDQFWKPAAFALLAVYWFNPLVWAAYILLCRDIELACDEAVIEELPLDGKKGYSMTLLACSSPRSPFLACPLAFGEIGVKQRVKNVLSFRKPAFWILAVSAAAAIILSVSFLTDPKTLPPDLSFLNIEKLIPLAEKQEVLSVRARDKNTTVGGADLAAALRKVSWREAEVPEAEPARYLTVQFYDFLELRFYADSPTLVQVVCGDECRYYAIDLVNYAAIRDLLLTDMYGNPTFTPQLTLKDVLELSELGEDLTSAKMYRFDCDLGRGTASTIFPINALFSLWVGSPSQGERVAYAQLRVNDRNSEYIDIRGADVTAFIAQYRDALLDIAAAEVLHGFAAEETTLRGDILSEGHEILASEITEHEGGICATLYIHACYAKCSVKSNRISGGSYLSKAVILTFEMDEAGMCTLTDSWQSGDCTDPEISERFPAEAAEHVRAEGYPPYLMDLAIVHAQAKLDKLRLEGGWLP